MKTQENRRQNPGAGTEKKASRVETLTWRVNGPSAGVVDRALDALVAADVYVTRLIAGLREVALDFREGRTGRALDGLAGATSGIRCLADILANVGRGTGVDTSPSADHEIGCLALCLHNLKIAEGRRDFELLATLIEEDLVPALARIAPTFPRLESRVAAIG